MSRETAGTGSSGISVEAARTRSSGMSGSTSGITATVRTGTASGSIFLFLRIDFSPVRIKFIPVFSPLDPVIHSVFPGDCQFALRVSFIDLYSIFSVSDKYFIEAISFHRSLIFYFALLFQQFHKRIIISILCSLFEYRIYGVTVITQFIIKILIVGIIIQEIISIGVRSLIVLFITYSEILDSGGPHLFLQADPVIFHIFLCLLICFLICCFFIQFLLFFCFFLFSSARIIPLDTFVKSKDKQENEADASYVYCCSSFVHILTVTTLLCRSG